MKSQVDQLDKAISFFLTLTVLLSRRAYQERFKEWGVRKYLKRHQKDKMLDSIIHVGQAMSPPLEQELHNNNLQKLLRYSKGKNRTDTSVATVESAIPNQVTRGLLEPSAHCAVNTPKLDKHGSSSANGTQAQDTGKHLATCNSVGDTWAHKAFIPLNPTLA